MRWDSLLEGNVDVMYRTNGGGDWVILAEDVANTGSLGLDLPMGVDSAECVLLVAAHEEPAYVAYESSGQFAVIPYAAGPPTTADWPSLGRQMSRQGLAATSGPELGCLKWEFDPCGPVYQGVTLGASGRVHVACENGKLYTLDPCGQVEWTFAAGASLLSTPTVGLDGTVYVGAKNNALYAVGPDGQLRWTHVTEGWVISTPAVAGDDGTVYVGSQDGDLWALGPDGGEKWRFTTSGPPGGAIAGAIVAAPALGADGTVYVGGLYDPHLYALDPCDGNVKWTCSFERPVEPCMPPEYGWAVAAPVVADNGTIYVGLVHDRHLYAIDPCEGTVLWQTDLADPCEPLFAGAYQEEHLDPGVWSEPALGPDGTIYVSMDDPYLRALDSTGAIKWVTRLGMLGGFTVSVGADGLVYAAGDDRSLYVVSPTGEHLAYFDGAGWLAYPVVGPDGTVYVCQADASVGDASGDHRVWALTAEGCEDRVMLHRPTDVNGDRVVDLQDFAAFADDWMDTTANGSWPTVEAVYFGGDVDRDRYVAVSDLLELSAGWLDQD